MEATDHASEWAVIWSTLAYGLLVCVVTTCIAYIVLTFWPRNHYPRIFSALVSVTTVAGLYSLQVPGSGFGLVLLLCVLSVVGFASLEDHGFWIRDRKSAVGSVPSGSQPPRLLVLSVGSLLGFLVALLVVSVFIVPPGYLQRWVFHPDPLPERIELALNPGEQWVAMRDREREASDALKKTQAELTSTTRLLKEAESALSKARDELGAAPSNTVRGIRIKERNGSRHANGAIYIGVEYALPEISYLYCKMRVSSDKADGADTKNLHIGEAITVQSSRGKHRIVLTALDRNGCTFDLVKD